MTADLYRRLEKHLPPFDGGTLTVRKPIPVVELQPFLAEIVEVLASQFGAKPLLFLHCWHEHDGWASEATKTTWDNLRDEVATPERLLNQFDGADTFVSRGFTTPDGDFYLRFYVHESLTENAQRELVDFDLSGRMDLLYAIVNKPADAPLPLSMVGTSAYFTERYKG
jgi:hypothetical protein